MASISVKSGPLTGRMIDVTGELVLGRESADVIIDDPEISRRHLVLRPLVGAIEIEDLGSSNGTFVDDQRIVEPTRVARGQTIRIGATILEVEEVLRAEPTQVRQIAEAPETLAAPITPVLVADVMDAAPAEVQNRATFREAAKLFVSEGTSDLVVRDGERYVGVLSEGDLLRALIPDFERDTMSVAGVSLQEAADLFLKSGSFNADRSVASLVLTRPISLSPSDTLLKAATVMAYDHIRRLPVLDGGDLVGMLSRAKLSVALLTQGEPVA